MISLLQLCTGWITLFVIGTDLFVVAPLVPTFANEYSVSASWAGLTVTAFASGYFVAAPLFGNLADRVGRRRVLFICLLAFAATNLMTADARGLLPLLLARLLCGISAAGVTPSIYALVGASAPAGRRATWMAIVLTGLLSSLPIGAPLGILISTAIGWPAIFIGLAVSTWALAALNQAAWRHSPGATAASASRGLQTAVLMQRLVPTLAWSTALYGMYTYLGAGLTALNYRPEDLAHTISVYGAAGFLGALIGGRIADRLGPMVAMRMALIGLSACFVVLYFAVQFERGVLPAVALTALTAQIFFPAQQARLLREFAERSSTALAWNNSALFLGMTMGSLAGGQAMAAGGLPTILALCASVALFAWAVCAWRPLASEHPKISRTL